MDSHQTNPLAVLVGPHWGDDHCHIILQQNNPVHSLSTLFLFGLPTVPMLCIKQTSTIHSKDLGIQHQHIATMM